MMINVTEMAKPFGSHKKPDNWLRAKNTQSLINALAISQKCDSADLVRVIKGGNEKLDQGTWMHQDLAVHYALFLDTDFAIWVNKQIKPLLQKGNVELDPDMLALTVNNYQKVLQRKDKYRKRGIEFNKILEQSNPLQLLF